MVIDKQEQLEGQAGDPHGLDPGLGSPASGSGIAQRCIALAILQVGGTNLLGAQGLWEPQAGLSKALERHFSFLQAFF